MFVFSNLVFGVARVFDALLNLYFWIVIVSAVLSWVNPDPYNPIVRFLYEATEPVLSRIRRWLPIQLGGIDFSPMLLILALMFVQSFLVQTLRDWAQMIG